MLTLAEIGKSFGARTLFENVSLSINVGERLALVGANGAGKSTLFSIILRETEPDTGTIALDRGCTLGYLPQETAATGDETILQLATAITPEHAELQRTLAEGDGTGATDTEAYHHAQGRFAELGAHALEPKAKRILRGLAFRETDFDRPARTMSGGWIMRAHLARLLVMEPDLLMLDEPTNHLDLESLVWLQAYLTQLSRAPSSWSPTTANFLTQLVGSIVEISNRQRLRPLPRQLRRVPMSSSQASLRGAAPRRLQKPAGARSDALQEFADRFRAKASKAAQAQSKLKQIERMEKIEAPAARETRTASGLQISAARRAAATRTITPGECRSSPTAASSVYKGLNFEAERGQRTVLVGPNGAGKSTLHESSSQASFPCNHRHASGAWVTTSCPAISPSIASRCSTAKHTVLQKARSSMRNPVPEVQTARTVLGSFLFQGDDIYKKVAVLSGGEKSRLGLVKLLLNPPNLLLMDEPTTHLDMASIDALIDAMQQYHGTIVFISHDVYFIRALAKKVWHISAGNLTPYAGDYDYYLEKSGATAGIAGDRAALVAGEQLSNAQPAAAPVAAIDKSTTSGPSRAPKTKEQKRLEAQARQAASAERRQAQDRLQDMEREIARLEARQKAIAAALEDSTTYSQPGEAQRLNRELGENESRLERLTAEWEAAAAAPAT